MPNESRLVDSADVEEIQQRLDALENEETMDVGVLDGFLTAAALAPTAVTEEDLLPYIFSAEGDPEAVPEDTRLLELIDARRREIAASLAAGYGLDPVILPPENDEDLRKLEEIHYTLEPWCMGFVMGSSLFWGEEVSESEDVLELLAPMMSHLDPESFEDPETALAHIKRYKGTDPKDVEEALLAVVESVFNLKKALCPNVPVKNESPKVGRNDPCPCGSGKKWKQCCGKN